MKKLKKTLLIVIGLVFLLGVQVHAEEKLVMMEVISDTQVYEQPNGVGDGAMVVMDLKAGTPVVVVDTSDPVWYQISYNNQPGYILGSNLKLYGDVEVLDEEFEQIAMEDEMNFYALMAELEHRKQAWIWGSIITILVVAIFAIGIISAVKTNKEKNEQKKA